MENSRISWTDNTFNPWIGCAKVSPGCDHCYAEAQQARWGKPWGPNVQRVRTSVGNWVKPAKWNYEAASKGIRTKVFCASLADICEDKPEVIPWRENLKNLIKNTPSLDWLLLTKRPENFSRMFWGVDVPANVWFGITAENQEQLEKRIPYLLEQYRTTVRFISLEPLLGPIDFSRLPPVRFSFDTHTDGVEAVNWVIVGGESGQGCRPMMPKWVDEIKMQLKPRNIPVFFKQRGGHPNKGDITDPRELNFPVMAELEKQGQQRLI